MAVTVLHQPGFIRPENPSIFDCYPWISWIFVMAAGYLVGSWYRQAGEVRRRKLLTLGAVLTVGFFVLRAINIHGDPSHWQHQRSAIMTVCSFFNVTKQPPSLLFLLMTLGEFASVHIRLGRLS